MKLLLLGVVVTASFALGLTSSTGIPEADELVNLVAEQVNNPEGDDPAQLVERVLSPAYSDNSIKTREAVAKAIVEWEVLPDFGDPVGRWRDAKETAQNFQEHLELSRAFQFLLANYATEIINSQTPDQSDALKGMLEDFPRYAEFVVQTEPEKFKDIAYNLLLVQKEGQDEDLARLAGESFELLDGKVASHPAWWSEDVGLIAQLGKAQYQERRAQKISTETLVASAGTPSPPEEKYSSGSAPPALVSSEEIVPVASKKDETATLDFKESAGLISEPGGEMLRSSSGPNPLFGHNVGLEKLEQILVDYKNLCRKGKLEEAKALEGALVKAQLDWAARRELLRQAAGDDDILHLARVKVGSGYPSKWALEELAMGDWDKRIRETARVLLAKEAMAEEPTAVAGAEEPEEFTETSGEEDWFLIYRLAENYKDKIFSASVEEIKAFGDRPAANDKEEIAITVALLDLSKYYAENYEFEKAVWATKKYLARYDQSENKEWYREQYKKLADDNVPYADIFLVEHRN